MGILDYLLKTRTDFDIFDEDNSCSSTIPIQDQNTFVVKKMNETIVIKDLGHSLEVFMYEDENLYNKSVTHKSTIYGYNMNKFIEKSGKIFKKYYETFDIIIYSSTGNIELLGFPFNKAEDIYHFLAEKLKR